MNILIDVLLPFLRLGITGFGGPLALVAQMQTDFVEKRQWIPQEEFQQAFTLIKSMPGAVAFNTAVYLGKRRAGFLGALLAGLGLVMPAFLMILFFAANYSFFHASSLMDKLLTGMQAGALALILAAVKPLTGNYLKSIPFWTLVATAMILFSKTQIPEPMLILGGGILCILTKISKVESKNTLRSLPVLPQLFWICFKAGAFVFGSGIAIAPMLEKDFVQDLHWITHTEFMDALAVGQITPGPVLLTTTFLGHKVAGLAGAILATSGVFLAGFIHMTTWFPTAVNKLSRQKWIQDFLFGALAMVVGTILATVIRLLLPWSTLPQLYGVMAFSLLLAWKFKIPSWSIILIGAGLGPFIL